MLPIETFLRFLSLPKFRDSWLVTLIKNVGNVDQLYTVLHDHLRHEYTVHIKRQTTFDLKRETN